MVQAIFQPSERVIQTRFYPLEIYGNQIVLSKDMLIYISPNVPDQLTFFSRDIDTIRTIFDLHFLAATTRDNYSTSPAVDNITDSILDRKYNYLFLTLDDWQDLTILAENQKEILQICNLSQDLSQNLVFLDC